MGPHDAYAAATLTILLAMFYVVRRIPVYLALAVFLVVGFAAMTIRQVDWQQPSEWIEIILGLLLWTFGLLIVRLMLVRSVSLRLLARIDSGKQESIVEDLGARFHDMRAFHLTHPHPDGTTRLTAWGQLVSMVVTVFYTVFRIEA